MRGRDEQALLEAARRGDERAFAELVEPRRAELHSHCVRMLGSVADAEDAIQEAMLRAWRALPRFEGRASLRSWLYRIATNVCLNAIAQRPKRVIPVDYEDAGDPHHAISETIAVPLRFEHHDEDSLHRGHLRATALEDDYEQRETIELALRTALEQLPRRQHAALILRDVLGYSARETAAMMATTTASVNSALQRARATLEERTTAAAPAPPPSDGLALQASIDEYVAAFARADVEGLAGMLSDPTVSGERHWSYAAAPAY